MRSGTQLNCQDLTGNGQVQLITFDGDLLWAQQLPGGGVLSLDLYIHERYYLSLSCACTFAFRHWDTKLLCRQSHAAIADKSPLFMESRPYLLAGSMDGSVTILDAQEGTILASSKAHTKYCVRVMWGPSVSQFVSVSWDQTLVLHHWTPSACKPSS